MFLLKLVSILAAFSVTWSDECPWVASSNPDCVQNVVCSKSGNGLYIYEDCEIDSWLITATDESKLQASTCDRVSTSGVEIKLASSLNAEKDNTVDCVITNTTDKIINTFVSSIDVNEDIPRSVDGGSFTEADFEENKSSDDMVQFEYTDMDLDEGSTLKAEFEDPEHENIFHIFVEPQDDSTVFKIGSEPLDFEQRRSYFIRITIISTDPRGATLNNTHTVLLNVVDVGDNPPSWTKLVPSTEFSEGTSGRSVFTVEAQDGDADVNNLVLYEITSGNTNGYFKIDQSTGDVTSNKAIDRESLDNNIFSLEIMAQEYDDEGQPATVGPTNASTTTTVYITDINDNQPTFDNATYEITMAELTAGNFPLDIDIFVFDMDEGENGEFDITSDHPDDIEIQPKSSRLNCSLSLTALWREDSIFDFEKDQDVIVIKLIASEKSNGSHVGETELSISLTDMNDNTPVFDKEIYEVSVNETAIQGDFVEIVAATDEDKSKAFGKESILYFILSCPELTIDSSTGRVFIAQNNSLDFEKDHQLECPVEAHDNKDVFPRNIGSSKIKINVVDVDDTPPVLDVLPSEVQLKENHEGNITITGTDEDQNADISFEINWDLSTAYLLDESVPISEVETWFDIETIVDDTTGNSFSGVVTTLDQPDREVADSISLVIEIVDLNTQANEDRGSGTLRIQIEDVNDCPPVFKGYEDSFSLKENAIGGTAIAEFSVFDPDLDDTVLFKINDDTFVNLVVDEMDPNKVYLKVVPGANIDRETMDQIQVNITAEDGAQNSNLVMITINVTDLNDNAPVMLNQSCEKTYQIYEMSELINEAEDTTTNGTFVWTFIAHDDDVDEVHSSVDYLLTNNQLSDAKNIRLPFRIDSETGNLSVFVDGQNRLLDREKTADDYYWDIYAIALDHCHPQELDCVVLQTDSYCLLHIDVMDVNDKAPGDFHFEDIIVNEFLKEGDLATEESSKNEYEIFANDADEEGTMNTNITYTITSVNLVGDLEDFDLFEAVTKSRVTGDQSLQYYSLLKAKKNFTGLRGSYEIHIMAEDAGTPPLNGTAVIPLEIQDSNDNQPIFNYLGCLATTNQVITVEENFMGILDGCEIHDNTTSSDISIKVLDDDIGDNGRVNVSIDYSKTTGGSQIMDFEFRFKNGSTKECVLVANNIIDREEGDSYNISLHATDHGSPPLETYSWIQIIVKNDFEFHPYFCQEAYCNQTVYIRENDTEATTYFQKSIDEDDIDVDPSDPDNYEMVYYGISGGDKNDFILVANNDTQLQVKRALDREEKGEYRLFIDSFNNDGIIEIDEPVARNFTLYLTIIVMDINDNPPVFEDSIIGSFTENDQKENPLIVIKADDRDLNTTLEYFLGDNFTWIGGGPSQKPATPFKLDHKTDPSGNNTIKLLLNFDPTGVNNGYCVFNLSATDGDYTSTTEIKIFAITVDFLIPVHFANTQEEVQPHKESIEDIFSDVYNSKCTVDSIDGTQETFLNADNDVTVKMHFIDNAKDEPVPKETIFAASLDPDVTLELYDRLSLLNLNLESIGDKKIDGGGDNNTSTVILIVASVVGFVLLSLVILLMIAYFVRTRYLERQIKVLSASTFGSHGSGLNKLGKENEAIPGSNRFLGEGSNPLYNLPDDDFKQTDNESLDSGDSVLVGVEDNKEFKNYGYPHQDSDSGYGNPGYVRSIDDVSGYDRSMDDVSGYVSSMNVASGSDPFSAGSRVNPLLEFGNGIGEDIDLSEGLRNYEMFVSKGRRSPEEEVSTGDLQDEFSFGEKL